MQQRAPAAPDRLAPDAVQRVAVEEAGVARLEQHRTTSHCLNTSCSRTGSEGDRASADLHVIDAPEVVSRATSFHAAVASSQRSTATQAVSMSGHRQPSLYQ